MDSTKVYKDCSEIPIFNFFEMVKTKDLKYLLRPGSDISDFNSNELSEVLMNMLKEYNVITDNSKLLQEYQAQVDLEYTEARYNISKKVISIYLDSDEIEVLFILKDLQWQFNELMPVGPQLKRIQKGLIGLGNKVRIKRANFVKKYKPKENKESVAEDLEKQVLYLESAIPLHYKIDIYEDSIKRFIYWNEILENKNKALSNG